MEQPVTRLSQLFVGTGVAAFKHTQGGDARVVPQPLDLDPMLLPIVLRLVQAVGRYPDIQSAASAFLQEVIAEVRPDCVGAVFMLDPDTNRYELRAGHGLNLRDLRQFSLAADEPIGLPALEAKQPMVFSGEAIEPLARASIQQHHNGRVPAEHLVVPLLWEDEVVGFANFEHYTFTLPFVQAEVQRFRQLTEYVAHMLYNAHLYEQAQQREREAVSLNRVLQAINRSLDLEDILDTIQKGLAPVCRFDLIMVVLPDPTGDCMRTHAVLGNRLTLEQRQRIEAVPIPMDPAQSVFPWVLQQNRAFVLQEASKQSRKLPVDEIIWEINPFRAGIFLPIRLGGEPIGVIGFGTKAHDLRLSEPQLALVERYVSHIGGAIENARQLEASRRAQQELMLKNVAVQSQAAQIQAQNETLNQQQAAILHQSRELETLMRIMHAINRESDLDAVLSMLLDQGLALVPKAQSAIFLVFNPTTHAFHCRAARGYTQDMSEVFLTWEEAHAQATPDNLALSSEVLLVRQGEPGDPLGLPRYEHLPNPTSLILLRIYSNAQLDALMVFDHYGQEDSFGEADVMRLQRLQEHAANAFSKARFLQQIQSQHAELEAVYQKVSDSIGYARRILEAILPRQKAFDLAFPDAFVLFRPRDVVSGDFYWLGQRGGKELIAAVDCTGHGIPGAFMAVLGNTLLGQIVNEKGFTDPGVILNELNRRVKQMLNQSEADSDNFDGMDIALLAYDSDLRVLQFAGAQRPLLHFRGAEVTEVKGMKQPVGGSQHRASAPFETHSLVVAPGDTVYIFTDGYVDQFGDTKRPDRRNRKFLPVRLRELLLRIQALPMHQQAEAIEWAIDEWRGTTAQLDDILVIGIRF